MGYMHLNNLYKDRDILLLRECYAMEKIHGTSAHVSWSPEQGVKFFAGGGDHEEFVALFQYGCRHDLGIQLRDVVGKPVTVYGEFYGGTDAKGQGMCETYGKASRFIVFDVMLGEVFLDVSKMTGLAVKLGLEVVYWTRIPATQEAIDAERDADSVQAVRNGMGPGKMREGVVLRPLIELRRNNGSRLMAKHRRPEFAERTGGEPREFDPEKAQAVEDAEAIAAEWVTPMRLRHVLDKLSPPAASIRDLGRTIAAMVEDVEREAEGEIVVSPKARTAIGRATADLFRGHVGSGK